MAKEKGTITSAKIGDLMVLEGDPAHDITAFAPRKLHRTRGASSLHPTLKPYECTDGRTEQWVEGEASTPAGLRLEGFFVFAFPGL